jgi:RHS repeat-associated protein
MIDPAHPEAHPEAPKSGTEQVMADSTGHVADTKASLSGAMDSVQALASGNGNMLDAAMGVKGAIDSVQNLSGKLSESVMTPVMKLLAPFKGVATLPAGKQMDPVLGIDVHVVLVPPLVPTPLPHPFVAILIRPKDWVSCLINTYKPQILQAAGDAAGSVSEGVGAAVAKHGEAVMGIVMGLAGLAASVKFGGYVPRAVTGTPTKNFPHIPFGAGWHPAFLPVAKNHGKLFLGSLFVAADGDPMAGAFHLNYDCWDVGIIDLFKSRRAGAVKPPDPAGPLIELYVPSGTVLPIPWGRPVLVNSIPTPINPLALADKLFKAGLGKLKGAMRKRNEKAIKKLGLPCAAKTAISKLLGTGQSHPVDVAEGYFYTDNEDFALPGPIPLNWERTWYSYSDYQGPLGHGWHHSYDMAIGYDQENRTATLRMADGRGVDLELPLAADKPTYHRKEKLWLHLHEDGYYFVKDRDGLSYRFTDKGYPVKGSTVQQHLLQSIANGNGFALRFSYGAQGWLEQLTDSAGRVLKVENDREGRITAIHAPHPTQEGQTFAIARYSYTGQGDMSAHTDALGQAMHFEYADHLMVKEVWRNGLTWQFVYNGRNSKAKCVEVWGDGNLLHYKFDYTQPGCTLVTNSLGHLKTFYHKDGLVIRYIDPNGAEWQHRYNRYSELEWTTDPLGNQSGQTHDEWGNVVTATEADGAFTELGYYDKRHPHLPTEATDERGGKWQWQYDEAGNLVKRTNPLKAVTKLSYEDGLLTKITDAIGAETRIAYDRDYNLQGIRAPNGTATQYRYDVLGNNVHVTNPKGAWQSKQYDLLSRATVINDFDGNTIQLAYDAIDNVIQYKDRLKDVSYTYSGLWKLRTRTEAGATIHFSYDTEEQLRKITNEQGLPYHFKLDPAGNTIAEIGFDGLARTYERNRAGWVTRVNRPAKRFTEYSYDEEGRVTAVAYQDGTTETYKYDKGTLQEAVNGDAVVEFERDVLGRVTKETCNGYEVISTYDIVSSRTHIGSSLGADIELGYDIMGDVIVQQAMGWRAETKRDEFGLEVEKELLGGLISKQERDNIGRVKSQWVGHTNTSLATKPKHYRRYRWDINDQLKEIVDQSTGSTTFEHDKWGNLAKTRFNDGTEQLRNPNAVGNLFETKDRRDRKYDKGGKLLESKTAFYSYDEEGNLTEKKGKNGEIWKYEWNAAGMLQKVTRPDKAEVRFKYDALGRRIEKRYKKTITKWVWDGNKPLHEWKEFEAKESSADELITWVFEEDSFAPAAKIKGEKKYSILTDHLGTPIQAFSDGGEKVWERQLDSYGKVKMLQGDEGFCNYLYQGQTLDNETGLAYNRFRYYLPEEGIYISQDPIGLEGGLVLYGYVHDPNEWLDIFGLKKKSSHRKPKRTKTKQTGRTKARNKNESYAMDHVIKHPENGNVIVHHSEINDRAFKGKGYNKMSQFVNGVDIHYMARFDKHGKMIEVTDFKFKDNKPSKKTAYAK